MGGIEPPCNKRFGKFLQELVCCSLFKYFKYGTNKILKYRASTFRKNSEATIFQSLKFITPDFFYETSKNLTSLSET